MVDGRGAPHRRGTGTGASRISAANSPPHHGACLMSATTKLSMGWIATHPDDHPQAGQQITRETTCRRCGRTFTQAFLNPELLEQWLPLSAQAQFARDVPGNWVPVFCPPCERRDLARGDVP